MTLIKKIQVHHNRRLAAQWSSAAQMHKPALTRPNGLGEKAGRSTHANTRFRKLKLQEMLELRFGQSGL